MNIRITGPVQGGRIRAIASKSEAHRLLICAALADKETFISCPTRSEDIDVTASCLGVMGAAVRYEQDGFIVTPVDRQFIDPEEHYILDCGESGSTLRFLLPVCGALGLRVTFRMSGRLPSRPLSGLIDEMVTHGCILSQPGGPELNCDGQLVNGTYTVPGDVSSQYVSGLLFALPLLPGESTVRVTSVLESRPYVDMTIDALRSFGITVVEKEKQVFDIASGQTGRSPTRVSAQGDWSNAAFWLCAGAIGKNPVTCTGLDPDSRQGDRAVVDLLDRFGACITCENGEVTVSPGKLRGIGIDAGDTPDLVPVLAAVATVAEGTTVIHNAKRLRIKESDRLSTVASVLSGLGADIKETEDGLTITGKKELTGGETSSFGDHRIAMTAAIISAVCKNPVGIRETQAVRKSYPGFFEDFIALGGEWMEV